MASLSIAILPEGRCACRRTYAERTGLTGRPAVEVHREVTEAEDAVDGN